ncbi:hypothetical protein M1523_04190 [Patescibacteria group bacterium]|nr:hypothetical protein [Patescibacteria group bacterium]MCL5091888.1 hypothetical protein [Patescibacteria group bacterium]
MQAEGRSQFLLTDPFLRVCSELGVDIPFVSITDETNVDSIEQRLQQAMKGPEGNLL